MATEPSDAAASPAKAGLDPRRTARVAGLEYVSDEGPGYTRVRAGKGFSYRDENDATVRDRSVRRRLEALVIPPAWKDVWICPFESGHLQATGRDDRGRKQYLYHPRWRVARDRMKFQKLVAFGHDLPTLRKRVGRDLKTDGLTREKALAAAVRLLDRTAIRVGNDQYAQSNNSYGLTTLRTRHVRNVDGVFFLSFDGKGGKAIELTVRDKALIEVLQKAMEMPGWHLLQYIDGSGRKRRVESSDVNEYLREVTGGPFTAKDFRTWKATVRVVSHLRSVGRVDSKKKRLSHWLAAVDLAADKLKNTRAVVRVSYLPPHLEPMYMKGTLFDQFDGHDERAEQLRRPGRLNEERWALAFLEDLVALPLEM